jgi:hypothetical protein
MVPAYWQPERASARRNGTAAGPLAVTARATVVIDALPSPTVQLLLYQGDDFTLQLDVAEASGDPLDLAGATPLAQIRLTPGDEFAAGEFDVTTGEDPGVLFLHLTHAVSTTLPRATVWDCQITQGGVVTTLAAGTITMTPEVSR